MWLAKNYNSVPKPWGSYVSILAWFSKYERVRWLQGQLIINNFDAWKKRELLYNFKYFTRCVLRRVYLTNSKKSNIQS